MDISEVYRIKKEFFEKYHDKLAVTVGTKAIHAFTAVELFVDYLTSEIYKRDKNEKDL